MLSLRLIQFRQFRKRFAFSSTFSSLPDPHDLGSCLHFFFFQNKIYHSNLFFNFIPSLSPLATRTMPSLPQSSWPFMPVMGNLRSPRNCFDLFILRTNFFGIPLSNPTSPMVITYRHLISTLRCEHRVACQTNLQFPWWFPLVRN